MSSDELFSSVVGAINADASNRHKDVNTSATLINKLKQLTLNTLHAPDLVTFSEIAAKQVQEALVSGALSHYAGDFIAFSQKEHLVTLWDTEKWEVEDHEEQKVYVSKPGKYIAVKLVDKQTKLKCLHVSVHLPAKTGRTTARKALIKLAEDETRDVDILAISGDFNTKPSDLKDWISDTILAFDDNTSTTNKGTSKDNVIIWDKCVFRQPQVYESIFHHYPIQAPFAWTENSTSEVEEEKTETDEEQTENDDQDQGTQEKGQDQRHTTVKSNSIAHASPAPFASSGSQSASCSTSRSKLLAQLTVQALNDMDAESYEKLALTDEDYELIAERDWQRRDFNIDKILSQYAGQRFLGCAGLRCDVLW